MRTVLSTFAAYAVGFLLVIGSNVAAQADIVGEEGDVPFYDIRALARVQPGDGTMDEMAYDSDDSSSSTQRKYAKTVFVNTARQVCLDQACEETAPSEGSARARANLYSGTIKAEAVGSAAPLRNPWGEVYGYLVPNVTARAGLGDLIFFNVGDFDMTNGLPIKVIFRVDGFVDTYTEVSSADVSFRATLTTFGPNPTQLAALNYLESARGLGAPEISISGSSGGWQFVNGAYEAELWLFGPLPVLQLVMDLEALVLGGRADYYHTAALSLELPPGVTFTSASGVLLTRPDFENDTPVANAGPDQLVAAGDGCFATVSLDGTGSNDPDDDPLTFTWTGPFGTASGPTPTVSLPVGTHTITLAVDDGTSGPAEDTVTVVVEPGNSGAEVCNGQDDDCDGTVDESSTSTTQPLTQSCYSGRAGTRGVGECRYGTQTCSSGTFGACVGEVTPATETCDGLDNDCDGAVDNGFNLGAFCTVGVGVCQRTGALECAATSGTQCSATPGTPGIEVCGDGIDQDCNGADAICPLTVLSPNSSEVWPLNSTQTIRWSSTGVSGKVRIELSRDGGATWKALANNTANTGALSWKVNKPATTRARIRVSSVLTRSVSDTSDGNFTIK